FEFDGALTIPFGTTGQLGAADGIGTAARFSSPLMGLVADSSGTLYVADAGNNTIRKIDRATKLVTTLVGTAGSSGSTDGVGAAARFNSPSAIAGDNNGALYVPDRNNHTIRKISLNASSCFNLQNDPFNCGTCNFHCVQ